MKNAIWRVEYGHVPGTGSGQGDEQFAHLVYEFKTCVRGALWWKSEYQAWAYVGSFDTKKEAKNYIRETQSALKALRGYES